MITAAFGMRCPHGHEAVQVLAGSPKCSVCGAAMVPNEAAQSVGVHRSCTKCGSYFGMIANDSGKCPACGTPWS